MFCQGGAGKGILLILGPRAGKGTGILILFFGRSGAGKGILLILGPRTGKGTGILLLFQTAGIGNGKFLGNLQYWVNLRIHSVAILVQVMYCL